jgi:hypothetical protein
VVDRTTEWQPDPYGAHELRLFSADGKPTLLVMDGGKTSFDRPPTSERPPGTEPRSGHEPEPQWVRAKPADLAPPATSVNAEQETAVTERAAKSEADDTGGRPDRPRVAVPSADDFDSSVGRSVPRDQFPAEWPSRPRKIAYGVVITLLALSMFGLVYVHFVHTGGRQSTQARRSTTKSSSARTTTTTIALPTALKPGAEAAATALVSSWSVGNRAAALTVATPTAVSTLFAVPYANGLALDRGCSTSIPPIVCTFGPPGGASPNDPIYQIRVLQATGGWYVGSVMVGH